LINYLMSLHILLMLKRENLITEEEFTAIGGIHMRKFSNKVMATVGTVTLAVGFMAFPVLAGTDQQQH